MRNQNLLLNNLDAIVILPISASKVHAYLGKEKELIFLNEMLFVQLIIQLREKRERSMRCNK